MYEYVSVCVLCVSVCKCVCVVREYKCECVSMIPEHIEQSSGFHYDTSIQAYSIFFTTFTPLGHFLIFLPPFHNPSVSGLWIYVRLT